MSQHQYILSAFRSLGYAQSSVLQSYEANTALDRLSASAGGPIQFDRDVAKQLWEHTPKHKGNTVLLTSYIFSIEEALRLLQKHIETGRQRLIIEKNQGDREDIEADLHSFANDHKTIAQTFHLPFINIDEIINRSRPNAAISHKMISLYGDVREIMWARTSPIFGAVPLEREQSWSLKLVLITTVVLFSLELFIMFHKNHFFNLVVYTLILLIYLQNYFDKLYMRITIISVGLAIIFDFLWLTVHAEVFFQLMKNWWNPYAENQHSKLQTGYLRFSYILVIFTMLSKMLILAFMFKYLNTEQTLRKSVTIFDIVFKLDGMNNQNPFIDAIMQAITPKKLQHEPLAETPVEIEPVENKQIIIE